MGGKPNKGTENPTPSNRNKRWGSKQNPRTAGRAGFWEMRGANHAKIDRGTLKWPKKIVSSGLQKGRRKKGGVLGQKRKTGKQSRLRGGPRKARGEASEKRADQGDQLHQ